MLINNENISEKYDNLIIYTNIAQALARGNTDLYYVNIETDELIEYHTDDKFGVLTEVRRSDDFFEGCKRDVKLFVHPDDQEKFVSVMNADFLREKLDESVTFEFTYRRIMGDRTFYVRMRVTRVENDPNHIVLAVSDIDELVKKRQAEQRMMEERIIYARLHAITGNFIVIYVVDPETNNYREFSATEDYKESFAQAKEGKDFFETVRKSASQFNHPMDNERFLAVFTKENVMEEVEKNGIFSFGYRLLMDGKPVHVQMKAAMVEENEGPRLIVGLNDIDTQVRQEKEMERRLLKAESLANIDELTGVKNKHAYAEAEMDINEDIEAGSVQPFAIVMMDINDLKKVNDTGGHQAGDKYLRDACKIICDIFKHSPVFRVGGDEFVVIAKGEDYAAIDDRLKEMKKHNEDALKNDGIVIACGMSKYADDKFTATVFGRADHNMYENKKELKTR